MKLKKKAKRLLLIIPIILILIVVGIIFIKTNSQKPEVKEVKVLTTIKKYDYKLKDNKSKKYKSLFKELDKILAEEKVDEEKYIAKISEMFIYDFYSLSDKTAKTDVGGVEFVHPIILENFLQNAENTFYKYVESNIYNNREQPLPTVDEVTVENITPKAYAYLDKTDEKAYEVKVSWTYTEPSYSDYQKQASLVFVHDGIKLYLVELK